MPLDGRLVLREHSNTPGLPVSANGGIKEAASPAEHRGSRSAQQLLPKRRATFWLLLLLVSCGLVAIRQTTRLLDAAGRQHVLLAPPASDHTTAAGAAGAHTMHQQLLQQHQSSGTAAHSSAGDTHTNTSSAAGAAGLLAAQRSRWPDGYVAVCAVIKDQWPDLRYWIEYHRWLGVSKFYIYDNNSTLPAMLMLWDYMQQGVVEYEYFLGRPRKKPDFTDTNQYRAYEGCLLQHFRQHRWLAFIDADEFFVFPHHTNTTSSSNTSGSTSSSSQAGPARQEQEQLAGSQGQQQGRDRQHSQGAPEQHAQHAGPTDSRQGIGGLLNPTDSANSSSVAAHSLALFLADFESHAAVGVNWVLFGSSGHLVRPSEGPLVAYTACVPQTHWESTHVKVIANTAGIVGIGGTPHQVLPRAGRSVVDVDHVPFNGPKTPTAKWHKLVLHHYVLKSKAEFVSKTARGSGAGNRKGWPYWEYVEQLANQTCSEGVPVGKAFAASNPQLAVPAAGRLLQRCHQQAVAAYEALLQPPLEAAAGRHDGGDTQPASPDSEAGSRSGGSSIDGLLPC